MTLNSNPVPLNYNTFNIYNPWRGNSHNGNNDNCYCACNSYAQEENALKGSFCLKSIS
jgi:hypothetical protein